MNRPVRTVLGAIAGLFFFLFVGVDALLLGVVPLHSPLLTALPAAGVVAGAAWAWWAPLRRRGAP